MFQGQVPRGLRLTPVSATITLASTRSPAVWEVRLLSGNPPSGGQGVGLKTQPSKHKGSVIHYKGGSKVHTFPSRHFPVPGNFSELLPLEKRNILPHTLRCLSRPRRNVHGHEFHLLSTCITCQALYYVVHVHYCIKYNLPR